ncbi:MAG: hypothetical protein MZU79_00320 [Anaerotruncus sp.]|nr:hypothetical protein [Anaerotruncus sp.]
MQNRIRLDSSCWDRLKKSPSPGPHQGDLLQVQDDPRPGLFPGSGPGSRPGGYPRPPFRPPPPRAGRRRLRPPRSSTGLPYPCCMMMHRPGATSRRIGIP